MTKTWAHFLQIMIFAAVAANCDTSSVCLPATFESQSEIGWVTGKYRIEHLRVVGHYAVFGVLRDAANGLPSAPANHPFFPTLLALDLRRDGGSQAFATLLAAVVNDRYIGFALKGETAEDPNHGTLEETCLVDAVNIHGAPKVAAH